MFLWSIIIVALAVINVSTQLDCGDEVDECPTLDQVDSVGTYSGRCELALEWRACLESYQIAGCSVDYPQDLDNLQATYCNHEGEDDAIPGFDSGADPCDVTACDNTAEIETLGLWSERCALVDEWRECAEAVNAVCGTDIYPDELAYAESDNCYGHGGNDVVDGFDPPVTSEPDDPEDSATSEPDDSDVTEVAATTTAPTEPPEASDECQETLDQCEAENLPLIESSPDDACVWALMWQNCDVVYAGPLCPGSVSFDAQERVDYYCGERAY